MSKRGRRRGAPADGNIFQVHQEFFPAQGVKTGRNNIDSTNKPTINAKLLKNFTNYDN